MGLSGSRRIGLLGGTFDPVHAGHLALARAARAALVLDELRFIPSGRSWQKATSGASGAQRLAMVELAIRALPGVIADDREVRRDGPTFTIDTLHELRAELGPAPALVLILGSDQLHNLATWHRHDELLAVAHLGVAQREQVPLDGFPAPVDALVRRHRADTLPDEPSGSIVFFPMTPVPVSATELRTRLARGERPAEVVPGPVLDYIEGNGLYRNAGQR